MSRLSRIKESKPVGPFEEEKEIILLLLFRHLSVSSRGEKRNRGPLSARISNSIFSYSAPNESALSNYPRDVKGYFSNWPWDIFTRALRDITYNIFPFFSFPSPLEKKSTTYIGTPDRRGWKFSNLAGYFSFLGLSCTVRTF